MSGAPKKDHAPKPDQVEYYQQEQLLQGGAEAGTIRAEVTQEDEGN